MQGFPTWLERARRSAPARRLRDAALFLPCYVALDWATFIYPLGPLYITPWNPQPALAIVLMVLGGLVHAPVVLAAIFLADLLVRDGSGGYGVAFVGAVILASGYTGIAAVLRAWMKDAGLRTSRDLTVFCATIVIGTALLGAAYVGALSGSGLLEGTLFVRGWLRFWIGDFVGILVTAPLLLALFDPARRGALLALVRSAEAWLQMGLLAAIAWFMFAGPREDAARLFYLLFIPLIWISVRRGLVGAIVATTIAQAGVLAGMEGHSTVLPLLELQALVAAFTLVGLFLGVLFDERQETEERLRQSLRLAAAGEMAGAIAHEVNQPLTALANYGQSAEMLLARGGDEARLREIVDRMIGEVRRTAEVIQRLRDLFSSGTTRLERVEAAELLEAARRIGEGAIAGRAIALELRASPGLPALFVDRVQVQLVLRNLLANAVDSLAASGRPDARIEVDASRAEGDMVLIAVSDNGPGIAPVTRGRLFQPFVSGKPVGMGLGLAVSRAIAEAHGGSLDVHSEGHGEFHLVLPCLRIA